MADPRSLENVLGEIGRPKIYAGSTHNLYAQRPSLWKYLVDARGYEIEFKAYQVAVGIRKISEALVKHEQRIQNYKLAQLDAMTRIEMRIRTRIIPLHHKDATSPVYHSELQGAVSDATIYIKSETILKVLVPTAQRLKNKLQEYEKLHVQLTLGNELDAINGVLGNLSSGVPLQNVVDKVLMNTERFADATGLDSTLADASSELDSATDELNVSTASNTPEKLITEMITKMMMSDNAPPTSAIPMDQSKERLLVNKLMTKT